MKKGAVLPEEEGTVVQANVPIRIKIITSQSGIEKFRGFSEPARE